jgi:galactokinase
MRTWAPGRVNLIGEHTDYSGGLVLPAATQFGISVDVQAPGDEIVLASDGYGAADPISPDGGGPAAVGWGRFAQAVAAELAALGRPAVGLTGTITSGVPPGAGLSSSAALEVAIGLALCAVAGFELEPLELALACQRAELRAVGVPCGILDQAACVLGRPGSAILLDCATLEHRFVPVPEAAAVLVVDSGVERRLESSGYGDRRADLERALALVGAERSTAIGLDDVAGLDAVSERRLRHVVTENERVRRFAEALETDHLETAGQLLLESHASLRDDYEVSVPEIDLLVELAESAGALGARIVGGGFGGAVLVLAEREREARVGERVVREYAARTGKETKALGVRPSAGAGILPA